MEAHPLNLAHQQHRRAEAHLINNKYDEAMQCHHNAAELLLDAMKSTTSSAALESITLQHSYHLKQKDLIKNKKEQYARVKKAVEHLKLLSQDQSLNFQGSECSKLQMAIYRTINESESLLNVLSRNKSNADQMAVREAKDDVDGVKTENSQDIVIGELQNLSQNLHSLVEHLILQVEVLKDENVTIKERVNYLEKERTKYLNLPTNNDFTYKNNFIGTNVILKDFANEPVVPMPLTQNRLSGHLQNRPINTTVERLGQQPHFDLTALKDD